ncbi:hypothetical protein CONPUDRAFT_24009, partial [Coniophora puteana RWD-64-598 SS2]
FDQAQIVMLDTAANTFEIKGLRQISILGKEEKYAFMAVVGMSASGDVLLTHFVYQGATKCSVPAPSAPGKDKA